MNSFAKTRAGMQDAEVVFVKDLDDPKGKIATPDKTRGCESACVCERVNV